MALLGRGTIGRCDFVGVGVALLEKVIIMEVGFEVSYVQAMPSMTRSCFLCLRIQMWNSQLLPQHHVCLHTAMSHHDDDGLNL